MKLRQFLTKVATLAGLVLVTKIAFSDAEIASGAMDLRAALLVFVSPILVLVLFQKESLQLGAVFSRAVQMFKQDNKSLMEELEKNTPAATGQYSYSHILKLSENHSDSMVKFAGNAYSARFAAPEMAKLIVTRIQAEDAQWLALCQSFGFLAKMAPYFGMTATVVGMIKLLQNMSDFSQISSNMALAMQGTLYGLVSFLLVYSPLQRLFTDYRSSIQKRNEMIAQWFILILEKADPIYIQRELQSAYLNSDKGTAQQASSYSVDAPATAKQG